MICDYGCGQKAIHQFKNGKWCCKKLAVHCPSQQKKNHEWYDKLSDFDKKEFLKKRNKAIKKTLNTDKFKNKMSNIIKEVWKNPNHIYNNKEHQNKRNKILSKAHSKPETKKLKSKIMKDKWKDKNSNLNNPKRSLDASTSMKKVWNSLTKEQRIKWGNNCSNGWTEDIRKQKSKSTKQKWLEEEYRLKMKNGRHNSPNKQEIQMLKLLNKLFPSEYKFVGNFDLFINGKNPDFINEKIKKLLNILDYIGTQNL